MIPEKTGHTPTRGPSAIWVNKPESGQLPSGVTHRTFHSEAHRADVGYCIYLPPGYGSDANRRYPVIYNLHGADGNELHGFREVEVLEAGIRAERWPAMIVVMPNGGKRTFYKDSHGTNASRERQRPGAVVAWATSGAGPTGKAEGCGCGALSWQYASADGGKRQHFLPHQRSGKLPRLKALCMQVRSRRRGKCRHFLAPQRSGNLPRLKAPTMDVS